MSVGKRTVNSDRVTIRVRGDLEEAIEEIRGYTHAANSSEVIRKAILVYHQLVMQKAKGNEPVVLNKVDDGPEQIPLFL